MMPIFIYATICVLGIIYIIHLKGIKEGLLSCLMIFSLIGIWVSIETIIEYSFNIVTIIVCIITVLVTLLYVWLRKKNKKENSNKKNKKKTKKNKSKKKKK